MQCHRELCIQFTDFTLCVLVCLCQRLQTGHQQRDQQGDQQNQNCKAGGLLVLPWSPGVLALVLIQVIQKEQGKEKDNKTLAGRAMLTTEGPSTDPTIGRVAAFLNFLTETD